jgi:hypothetical protein
MRVMSFLPILAKSFSYEIIDLKRKLKLFMNIKFTLKFSINGRSVIKKFAIIQLKENKEKINSIITKNIESEKIKAIGYGDKYLLNKIVFQKGLTYFQLFYTPFILIIHTALLLGSGILIFENGYFTELYLIRPLNATNIDSFVVYIKQSPIGYFFLLNIFLLLLSIGLLIIQILKHGLKSYRRYPMFINEEKRIEYDFISELIYMKDLCANCNEIIKQKEKYCSECGTKVS